MSQETQSAAPSKLLDPIEDVIQAISQGQMVVVVDDEHRENEGDLVMAGQWVNAEAVTFMAKMGGGLICVPTTEERLRQLGISEMVSDNRDSFRTDFQVSVDAAKGITSGISGPDRALTVQVMATTAPAPPSTNRAAQLQLAAIAAPTAPCRSTPSSITKGRSIALLP